jgi:hypothetical protein
VSKNSYPYPPDEFDSIDPNLRPQEVHAARRSTWSRVWPFIVVIVVVPAIALGVVKVLSSWDNSQADPSVAGTVTSTATVTDVPPPPTSVLPGPTGSSPSDSAAEVAVEDPAGTADVASAPPIDRAVPVRVFNAKHEDGLAARASDLLRQDSWNSVTPENYSGNEAEGASAVYYGKNVWSTSAESVAGILGIDLVEKDTEGSPDGITVILRQDFTL